jgi:hypothetical protein
MTTTTTTTPEELYKLQHEINTYVAQKEELYKQLKDSQFGYNIDTAKMDYDFNKSTRGLSAAAKYNENKGKYQALKAYFVKNYNENTKMRDYYFKEIDMLNQVIREQESELGALDSQYNKLETEASTDYRRLKAEKYLLAQQDYIFHLYVVAIVVQIAVLLVFGLAWNGSIPRLTAFIVMIIGFTGFIAYTGYILYLKPGMRDPVSFNKYRFPVKSDSIIGAKTAGNKSAAKRASEKEIESKVGELLSNSAGKCS